MASGWLSVLKLVPWVDVISNAPRIAEEAKKLWNSGAKKPVAVTPRHTADGLLIRPEDQAQALAELRLQVEELQASAADLNQQMQASSQIIKALAEHNTQLIERVEAGRIRGVWLTRWIALLSVAVAIQLMLPLLA